VGERREQQLAWATQEFNLALDDAKNLSPRIALPDFIVQGLERVKKFPHSSSPEHEVHRPKQGDKAGSHHEVETEIPKLGGAPRATL
jgi:hypothetical protein